MSSGCGQLTYSLTSVFSTLCVINEAEDVGGVSLACHQITTVLLLINPGSVCNVDPLHTSSAQNCSLTQAQSWPGCLRFPLLYRFPLDTADVVVLKPSSFFIVLLSPCPLRSISSSSLDRSIILLQELLQRMRKLFSFGRNVQMSIDCFPAQVLQGRQATGQRSDELQRDLLTSRVNVVHIPTTSVPFALRHIVMNQLEDTVKMGNRLNVFRVCLQVKRSRVALDTQILGARSGLDTEGEKVPVV